MHKDIAVPMIIRLYPSEKEFLIKKARKENRSAAKVIREYIRSDKLWSVKK